MHDRRLEDPNDTTPPPSGGVVHIRINAAALARATAALDRIGDAAEIIGNAADAMAKAMDPPRRARRSLRSAGAAAWASLLSRHQI